MRLSDNFFLKEFLVSNVATRRGFILDPPKDDIRNLQLLCMKVLQPLRDKIGRPIRINSGWRSAELNKAIGGAYKMDYTNTYQGQYIATSAHCKGQAADIKYVDKKGKVDNKFLFDTILDLGIEFDQMINEFNYSWIHISYVEEKVIDGVYRKNNRNQLLEAYREKGSNKTKYKIKKKK